MSISKSESNRSSRITTGYSTPTKTCCNATCQCESKSQECPGSNHVRKCRKSRWAPSNLRHTASDQSQNGGAGPASPHPHEQKDKTNARNQNSRKIKRHRRRQSRTIGAWTVIGNGPSSYLERFTSDTFKETITRGTGRRAPLIQRHEYDKFPVGKPLSWSLERDGLYCEWQLDLGSEQGREAYRLANEGFVRNLSVGFLPGTDDRIEEGQQLRVTRGPALLREVSLVAVGAYPEAAIVDTRTAAPPKPKPEGNLTNKLNALRIKQLSERVLLASFGPERTAAYERTTLQRINERHPGLLFDNDRLKLHGDGTFQPIGPKRNIVRETLDLGL